MTDIAPTGSSTPFTLEDLDAVLVQTGAIEKPLTSFNRIKVDGANFVSGDEAWQTPIKGGGPAFVARIVTSPEQLQSKWFDAADAASVGRDGKTIGIADITDQYCKSHFEIETEKREFSQDGTNCRTCVFNPFEKGVPNKCGWKANIQMQIFPDGDPPQLVGNEEIYTITLSTSAMFAWQGPSRNGEANFIKQLNEFGIKNAEEIYGVTKVDTIGAATSISRRVLSSLKNGDVAAEVRSVKRSNEALGREWYIPVFKVAQINPNHDGDPEVKELEADLPF